jgi:hypothetical protein
MEQEITHHSRGKLHVGQITVRESARSTQSLFEIGAPFERVIFRKITLSQFNNYGY